MAERANSAGAGAALYCSVCRRRQESQQRIRSLRCGHPMCQECSATERPVCTRCPAASSQESRPQSFAELPLEMTIPRDHRYCEEKPAESCQSRDQTEKCNHCSLYLCPQHSQRHREIVLDKAAEDVKRLQEIRRMVAADRSQILGDTADAECRQYKNLVEAKLAAISQAVQALGDGLRRPIVAHEEHLERHARKKVKALEELDKMLGVLNEAMMERNHEAVLSAQRAIGYTESTGGFFAAQHGGDCELRRFPATLDAAALDGLIDAAISALQGLRDLRLPEAAAPRAAAEHIRQPGDQTGGNRVSCFYTSIEPTTPLCGSAIVTFEKPLDVDCYAAANEPLTLFVTEANADETKVTLRSYTEPHMECKEIPIAFVRNQQLIATFQPRRLAVLADKRLIAMTDVRSSQYSRHIFVCNFAGDGGHKVFRIERAKKLNGIHASGSRIYVCDTSDCAVFIVDCSDSQGRHKRVPCGESVPISVSTWRDSWMLAVCGHKVAIFSLDSLLPVQQAGQSAVGLDGPGGAEGPTRQSYRDIVHLSNGNFALNTATSVSVYQADMSKLGSFGGSGPAVPGVRFGDLMGMCAAEREGRVKIFLCDRSQQQIIVVSLDS